MKPSFRYATLLEVLIATALTVIILMTLTFFYRETIVIGNELDHIKIEDFHLRYIENRLADVLPKTIGPIPKEKGKDFIFFSTGDEGLTKPGSHSLIFTYDNGVCLDKTYSNHVLGRLYLDPNGRLTLAYWPSPLRWEKSALPSMRKEILLENIDNLTFSFFVAPERSRDKSEEQKSPTTRPEPKGDWRTEPWLKEFNELPIMVKVIIKLSENKQERIFIFPLVNSNFHVVYQ